MSTTSADIFNLVAAGSIGVVSVFLAIALFYLILVLRDISETTKVIRRTAASLDEMLIQPLAFVAGLIGHVGTFLSMFEGLTGSKRRRK